MKAVLAIKKIHATGLAAWLVPAISFWLVLVFKIPYSFTQYFHRYVPVVFLAVLLLYFLSFRLRGDPSVLAVFGLTMLLFALTLSYLWASGFSDNMLIGGLLPYKDAKNYYQGAGQILNGLPVRLAVNAVRRPLFSGFLSSLLLLTGQNLKLVLAMLVQLAGIGLYLSARQIRQALGAFPAALYIAFMYFYFQPFAGYAMSESLGFIGGCFGFVFLWRAAMDRKWLDLLIGMSLLLVAVSARAGAFLIFPLLALWIGWIFRRGKRISWLPVLATLTLLAAGYFVVNTVYPRLLGVPEGSSFDNFAYTIYGQARGGIGWHNAIDELETRNPSRIYQAAWDYFLAHPSGILQGAVKAYADFFIPGLNTIFVFGRNAFDLSLWTVTILIVLRGLYLLIFKLRSNVSTLLLVGFAGIILSIPFLPPIDGGGRFYASTMPFFFVLPAVGAGRFSLGETPAPAKRGLTFLRFVSVSLLVLTVLLPPVTLRVSSRPALSAPVCPMEQRPFAIKVDSGAYIDLVKNENEACGLVPGVCLADFRLHNTEMGIDDFYQTLDSVASSAQSRLRIIPAINLLDGYFQYFVAVDSLALAQPTHGLLSGCATRIQTENQRIFWVESISTYGD